jgi:hypothetical protein
MADNELWDKLLSPDTLKAGWNLARNDAKNNFFDAPLYTDAFAISFQDNVLEIVKRLATNTYRPAPITCIDVPKSTLATRPGTLPDIEDRIVLQSIVRLLAPVADKKLSESVYSYRVRENPTPRQLVRP